MTPNPKVLLVDDKLENLIALEGTLASIEVECIRALSGKEALQQVLRHDFALLIIDVQMPELDGYQTVELLRQSSEHKHLPMIFISAVYSDDYYKIKGFEVGAIDFIAKPFVPEILIGKVRNFLEFHAHKMTLSFNAELIQLNQQLQKEIKRRKQIELALQLSNNALRQSNQALQQSLEVYKDRVQHLHDTEQYRQFIQQAKKSIQVANEMLQKSEI